MPASSKAQQRFFGVVKAMQKGDIPKTGKAGKIAKTMDKDDVDKYASTKHKGKPEKVKREQRVRELIKKMVREELNKMNEKKLPLKTATKSHYINLIKKELESKKGQLAYAQDKVNYKGTPDWEKKEFKGVAKDIKKDIKQLNVRIKQIEKMNEGTCGYGENGELGEEPAGPHLIKKKIKESGRNIAKTILQQLGGNKFIAMTGAKNLGFTNNGLQMKIGRNSKGITHVIISLKSTDTYDVEFIKMRGVNRKVVKKLKGVYADQLGKIFTKFTGLRTRLWLIWKI